MEDVDLALEPGQLHLLMGRSGAGKSVLVKAALGFLPLASGVVRLHGQVVSPTAARGRVILVHQQPALLDERSALANVAQPLRWRHNTGRAAARRQGLAALEQVGAQQWQAQPAGSLPMGVQKLVAVARALAQQPDALVLDEPTTGLDAANAATVGALCGSLARAGVGIVVVTHDLPPFADALSHVTLLHRGRVVCSQPRKEALEQPHPALHQLLSGEATGPLQLAGPEA